MNEMKPPRRRILRLPATAAKTGLARTTIYGLMAKGLFPRQIPLVPSGRAVGWDEAQLDEFLEQQQKRREGQE